MKNAKPKHKNVKAVSAEIAYQGPDEVNFETGLVIQGMDAWRKYRVWRKQSATLEPEVRKAFPDDQSVNEALKVVMEFRHRFNVPPLNRKKLA